MHATELGTESLDMSAKCVEFVKRGHKEYKALEVIVKGWKAKAVEVVSEVLPKKHMTHASKAKAFTERWCAFSALLSACLSPCLLHLLCTVYPALLGTWCTEARLVGSALNATCQSTLVISVSTFTIFHAFGVR